MPYYYVGHETVITAVDYSGHNTAVRAKLNKLGQTIEASEQEANEWRSENVPLLTEDEWKQIGFTPDELKLDTRGKQTNASKEFSEKLHRAWSLYGESRQKLRDAKAAPAAQPLPVPVTSPEANPSAEVFEQPIS